MLGMALPKAVAPLFKGKILSRKRIALIFGLSTVALFAFFISIISSDEVLKNDQKTDIPPATTVTVSDNGGSNEWTSEERAYLDSFAQINGSMSEALEGIGQFTSKNPTYWTQQDLAQLAYFTVFIEKGYTDAKALEVSPKLENLHTVWVEMLKVHSDAMPLFRAGIDARNAQKVNQANALFAEGQRLQKVVTEEMKKVGL